MEENRFNPEMLVLARLSCEMTQSDLAQKAETTQGRLSKIENGLLEPTDDLVEVFAKMLDYPVGFFYQSGHVRGLPATFFRKRARVSRRAMDRISAEVSIRALNIRTLLRSAEIEADYSLPHIDVDESDPEDIARVVRQLWDMPRGPVANLVEIVERVGIVVVPCDFGVASVDALGVQYPDLPPMMFVNTSAPPDRLRLTVAHELGHLVMHVVPTEEMEKEAMKFAAEFLMPEYDIKPQFRRVTLPTLATLKKVWRVSMQALLYRARELRAITARHYKYLMSKLSTLGFRKREPAELDPPREEPTLLANVIEFHKTSLDYEVNQIAKALNLNTNRYLSMYGNTAGSRLRLVG